MYAIELQSRCESHGDIAFAISTQREERAASEPRTPVIPFAHASDRGAPQETVYRALSAFVPSKGGDGGTPALHAMHALAPMGVKPKRKMRTRRGAVAEREHGLGVGNPRVVEVNTREDAGGTLFGVAMHGGSGAHARNAGNGQRVLNCCDIRVTRMYVTADPFDRAHTSVGYVKVGDTVETGPVPAARVTRGGQVVLNVRQSQPRMYPQSQMTSRGVSIDSAFDGTHELLEWMKREGLTATMAQADPLSVRARMGAGGTLRARTRG